MANNVAGVDVLLKVKTGTAPGVWTTVGGQKGASLSRSSESIDITSKSSNGWSELLAGNKSWSVDCDGFVALGDAGLEALITAFESKTALDIEIRVGAYTDANGYSYNGKVIITDFPEEYAQDDAVTFSLSLQGASALTRTKGVDATPTAP